MVASLDPKGHDDILDALIADSKFLRQPKPLAVGNPPAIHGPEM